MDNRENIKTQLKSVGTLSYVEVDLLGVATI